VAPATFFLTYRDDELVPRALCFRFNPTAFIMAGLDHAIHAATSRPAPDKLVSAVLDVHTVRKRKGMDAMIKSWQDGVRG
jgi:hypothetical protein